MSRSDHPFSDLKPTVVMPGDPRLAESRVALLVVAHPDDVEGHCGGTVRLMALSGCSIHLIVCTSGEKGTANRALGTGDVAEKREAEQLVAAAMLGIASTTFLRHPDGEVVNGRVLRSELVRQIRRHRPDLVLTHDPEFPWPPYTAHRDHRAVGRATLDALYPDARDHLFFPEQIVEQGLETHITPEAWLIMSRIPDLFVEIGATIDQKIAARLAHVSQYVDAAALDRSFRERAAETGTLVGVGYAEAFKVVRFA